MLMNTPGLPTGSGTPSPPGRREVHLQGPRPSPLRVNKESHKIKKPPPVPRNPPQQQQQYQPLTLPAANDDRQPVIIYDVSPKVIHADASNFMSVVQQLTGNYSSIPSSSTDPFLGGDGSGQPVSPAARLASIERTSPTERTRERERNAANGEFAGMLEDGIDISSGIPGILSPAPSNLPGISSAMFSPVCNDTWGFSDCLMSPPVFGNSFVPSPYALLSSASPGVSPTIPSVDLFNFRDL